MESADFRICYGLSMSHTNAVSLVASRCVDDERQQIMCSRKKLCEHPCVRVTAVDFLMVAVFRHYHVEPADSPCLMNELEFLKFSFIVLYNFKKARGHSPNHRVCQIVELLIDIFQNFRTIQISGGYPIKPGRFLRNRFFR